MVGFLVCVWCIVKGIIGILWVLVWFVVDKYV